MKKIFLAVFISCSTLALTAQSNRSISQDDWLISVGVNTINSLGSKNPFESPGDWGYKYPITASVETKFVDLFSIEVGFSLNGINDNQRADGPGAPEDNLTYFAIDTGLKYYFGEYIFPKADWIDFYGTAGLGLFFFDDPNISLNVGGGALFWLDRRQTFGIKPQGMAKFALDHSNQGGVYPNNHFQYSLMAVFAF
jgi:hypothetical protein